MWLRNNSKRSWLQYNCGGEQKVDVLPESVFEVTDSAGEVLLKNLGHPAWVQATVAPVVIEEPAPVLQVSAEVEGVDLSAADGQTDTVVVEAPPFCDQCDSKGGPAKVHKKDCPTNKSEDEVDPVGGQEESASS